MRFIYKERYLKRFDRFPAEEQTLILETDQQIRAFYATRQAPTGLGIKLLYRSGPGKVFEARASRGIRIVWAERGDMVSFVLVGLHDEVKRYLRSLR
jgi:hypothetical protein